MNTFQKRRARQGSSPGALAAKLLSGAVAASLVALPLAGTAVAVPTDQSEGQAQVLRSDLFANIPVANLGFTNTGNPSNPGPSSTPLNLGLLVNENVNLGSLTLPLIGNGTNGGLLNLGALGALNSYSTSPSGTKSSASSGLVGADGAIQVSPGSGVGANPAYVDLTSLFGQLGIAGLTNEILDQARVELGALASQADQTGTAITSKYVFAGLNLKLRSPLVAKLSAALTTAINTAI
ncbi:choice-of-anchor G family protein [Renibacterium salmoninarum]|uniref:choice-of-anchor G family protein n=1 Tax=Renibacterium salmoninarum TaxID=1646 RepID=UPI0013145D77|nr:choice-of-anchor G family protein [Renibacterium salmoninarum]